jgi:hypothetical protein
MDVIKFETGKTYETRSPGDHGCVIKVTIQSRTPKTITTTDGKRFRPSVDRGAEEIMPWGNISMGPVITARKVA